MSKRTQLLKWKSRLSAKVLRLIHEKDISLANIIREKREVTNLLKQHI